MNLIRRLRGEPGFTLAELAVVLAIMTVATTATLSLLFPLMRSVTQQQERSDTNDQARIGVERLDRDIRSGNVLGDPSGLTPAYYALSIYTQSNANEVGNPPRCVQWRLNARKLERRSWPPSFGSTPDPATVSSWRTESTGIVNQDLGVHAFESEISTAEGVRTVAITILANSNYTQHPAQTVRIEISATGRNTSFKFPTNACTPVPA